LGTERLGALEILGGDLEMNHFAMHDREETDMIYLIGLGAKRIVSANFQYFETILHLS
jgi:hypothetical protein